MMSKSSKTLATELLTNPTHHLSYQTQAEMRALKADYTHACWQLDHSFCTTYVAGPTVTVVCSPWQISAISP